MNRSVAHTGTLHVDATPEHAFQLFTAPGEKLWVDGWDPVVLRGGDGRSKGSVFVTDVGADTAYWVVVNYDVAALHARYARIAPGTRAGTVEVFARDDGAGATEVSVTYELTALTDAGNEQLADFDGDAFQRMLGDWERLIREANLEYPLPFAIAQTTSGAVSADR
ncbi:MAG: SRPBCC family protein [Gammaproteobacteria bacterium]|jgi:hypothetical protein|nr:SRPBCC family protein [Gammaproteobacteria bacterium]